MQAAPFVVAQAHKMVPPEENGGFAAHKLIAVAPGGGNQMIGVELHHAGRNTNSGLTGEQPVAPSEVPCVEAGGEVPRPDVYRTLGQGEMQAGRSLDSLLSAYRIGARVAWRRFSEVGVEQGLESETLFELAESIFAYIDLLSAESAQGHAAAQSAARAKRRTPSSTSS